MKKTSSKSPTGDPQERLRRRIRRTLSRSGLTYARNTRALRRIENLTLELFRDFSAAPASKRAEVYAKGEQKILNEFRKDSH